MQPHLRCARGAAESHASPELVVLEVSQDVAGAVWEEQGAEFGVGVVENVQAGEEGFLWLQASLSVVVVELVGHVREGCVREDAADQFVWQFEKAAGRGFAVEKGLVLLEGHRREWYTYDDWPRGGALSESDEKFSIVVFALLWRRRAEGLIVGARGVLC